jgi:hypothetical protein
MQRTAQAGVALPSSECFVERHYMSVANGVSIGKYKHRGRLNLSRLLRPIELVRFHLCNLADERFLVDIRIELAKRRTFDVSRDQRGRAVI